jgi:hypothetical protein
VNGLHKSLAVIAVASLAVSAFTLFSLPVPGAACAIAALLLSIYLKMRGAFSEGNTPLLGALLIGGSGIMSIGGGLVVVSHASEKAAIILFLAMLAPGFVSLVAFGYWQRWRRLQSWIERQPDEPSPPP